MKTKNRYRWPAITVLMVLSALILCLGVGCNSTKKSAARTTSTGKRCKSVTDKFDNETDFTTAQGKKEYLNLQIPKAGEIPSKNKSSLYYMPSTDLENDENDFVVAGWEQSDRIVVASRPNIISPVHTPGPAGTDSKDMPSNGNDTPDYSPDVNHNNNKDDYEKPAPVERQPDEDSTPEINRKPVTSSGMDRPDQPCDEEGNLQAQLKKALKEKKAAFERYTRLSTTGGRGNIQEALREYKKAYAKVKTLKAKIAKKRNER